MTTLRCSFCIRNDLFGGLGLGYRYFFYDRIYQRNGLFTKSGVGLERKLVHTHTHTHTEKERV